jgi:hypothetical protein
MLSGMSVPGASDLGLGANLADQVKGETDEQRRKRMQAQMLARTTGVPGASALGLNQVGGGAGMTGY